VQEFVVIPYLIDLESTNGTKLNGETVEPAKYYELRHKDLIQFGFCKLDFVLMRKE